MMNLLISLLVFALIFGGALAGMAVRPLLSEHHLHSDSKDVVKLTAGLIGTLTALVLGLLIASAKTTGRSGVLAAIFGVLSPYPKIPFPATVVSGSGAR